jgi:two-component system LytT family response regulator
MIDIFIAEDEPKTLNSLINIVSNYCSETNIVGTADTVNSAVNFLEGNHVDLVLLDINYPDGNGFDILEKLPDHNFKVIFITAFEQYAIKAIKFSAVDYILKPIDPKELIDSVKKIQEDIKLKQTSDINIKALLSNIKNESGKKHIVLRTQERIHVVKIKDIIRCESDSSYTIFHMANDKRFLISKSLSEYDELLTDYGFIRTHKSHLVNADYIRSFEKKGGGYLILKDNVQVPVSVRRRDYVIREIEKI